MEKGFLVPQVRTLFLCPWIRGHSQHCFHFVLIATEQPPGNEIDDMKASIAALKDEKESLEKEVGQLRTELHDFQRKVAAESEK